MQICNNFIHINFGKPLMVHSQIICLNGIWMSVSKLSSLTRYREWCHTLMSLRNLLSLDLKCAWTLVAKGMFSKRKRELFKPTNQYTLVTRCQSISSTQIALTSLSCVCCTDLVCQSCSPWHASLLRIRDLVKESKLPRTIECHLLWTTRWVILCSQLWNMHHWCYCSTVTGLWTINNSLIMYGTIKIRLHKTCCRIIWLSTEFANHLHFSSCLWPVLPSLLFKLLSLLNFSSNGVSQCLKKRWKLMRICLTSSLPSC